MTAIITIKNGKKVVSNGMHEEKTLLEDINLTINEGDFITVLVETVQEKVHFSIPSQARWNSAKGRFLLKIS